MLCLEYHSWSALCMHFSEERVFSTGVITRCLVLRHVAPNQLSDTGPWPRDQGGYETLLTSRQVSRADYNKEFITKYLSSTHVNHVGDH